MLSKIKELFRQNSKPNFESEVNWLYWKYLSLYFGGTFLYNYAFFNNNGNVLHSVLVSFAYAFAVFYPMMKKVKAIKEKHSRNHESEEILCLPDNSKHEMSATFDIIDRAYKDKKKAEQLKEYLK